MGCQLVCVIRNLKNSPYFCVFKYARNKRSGTRLKTESETGERRYGRVRLARFARVTLLRHALTISLLILRKKRPTVLQSTLFVERYLSRRSVLPMYCLQQWLYSTM